MVINSNPKHVAQMGKKSPLLLAWWERYVYVKSMLNQCKFNGTTPTVQVRLVLMLCNNYENIQDILVLMLCNDYENIRRSLIITVKIILFYISVYFHIIIVVKF